MGVEQAAKMLVGIGRGRDGQVAQADAQTQTLAQAKIISTNPPYYDNIVYADLSDFFYVWLRRNIGVIYPELFSTMLVPKNEELVASPYRHGNSSAAELFFLNGMTIALNRLSNQANRNYPVTIFYAFRQSESEGKSGISSTGWETFLSAVIQAGFSLTGTWPMRTEYTGNLKNNTSALASSIWKCLFHLLRALQDGGEPGAGKLLRRIGVGKGETAKTLAYRLYAIADRKGWSSDATLFNGLVLSWPEILKRASAISEGEQAAIL